MNNRVDSLPFDTEVNRELFTVKSEEILNSPSINYKINHVEPKKFCTKIFFLY